MWLSASEKADIFNRLRDLETDTTQDREIMKGHIEACIVANKEAKDAAREAASDRKAFRREVRALLAAVICAIITVAAGLRANIL